MDGNAHIFPSWFDPRLPSDEQCVLGPVLDAGAREHPDRSFAKFEGGPHWTWAETRRVVRQTAQALHALGVKKGDAVLVWLPNGPAIIRAWFGANYAGAVYAPVNISYRGALLEHVIRNSGAKVMIAHAALLERLKGIDLSKLERVVCVGAGAPVDLPIPVLPESTLDGDEAACPPSPAKPWDTMAIIYTSGTTGPSKGVLCSYLHFYTVGTVAVGFIEPHERCFVHMPLFHIGAAGGVFGTLLRRASVGIVEGFSTDRFWDQIRALDCATCCGLVGSVVAFLSSRPELPNDADNPLRRVLVAPVSHQLKALAKRHNFEYFTGFGMSELPVPLVSEMNTDVEGGYCGLARSGVECRVVDEHDIEVPPGVAGELIARADLPWSINHGYVDMPEATVKAWRNGWFHTGDAFVKDAEGRFFFVDRLKDAIRRRGENISSLEVEKIVLTHPAILDVAAVPVRVEHFEDEVMVVVEAKDGMSVDPRELVEFLIPRMAHFMVPRFVRLMKPLPKTPTGKVQKPQLREQGVTADTWDREAAGIRLKREKLG